MADKSLNTLKKWRGMVNWEETKEREIFFHKFYHLIYHWEGQRPNFRDIFCPAEINWFLQNFMIWQVIPEPFIDLLIEAGYKDEPDVDQNGKPLWRRSTAVHAARGRYPEWERSTRELFKIYDRFDVNYTNTSGLTHFHVACEYGLVEVVEKFLEDPNLFESCDSATPLSMAVRSGHRDVALLLLIYGADPNLANEKGFTILHFLGDSYTDVQPLKMLFEICDELNQPLQIEAKDKSGRTPLQWAVARLLPNTVDVLLDRGADLSGFVFPAESDFGKIKGWHDVDCESRKISGALLVAEHLEKRGYELDRSDALTIMHFFAENKLLEKSSNRVKRLKNKKEFEKRLKNPRLSRFFRRWALDPLLELTRYRLPILCCEIIIRNLMNEDLFHICLVAADEST